MTLINSEFGQGMLGLIHAFDFLDAELSVDQLPALVIVYGDEPFLKQRAVAAVRMSVECAGGEGIDAWDANDVRWKDVSDELLTPSLFGGGKRVLLVRQADAFVTANRGELEAYVARDPATATLVLELKSWPGNTRLAKAVAKTGLAITCRVPERTAGR